MFLFLQECKRQLSVYLLVKESFESIHNMLSDVLVRYIYRTFVHRIVDFSFNANCAHRK